MLVRDIGQFLELNAEGQLINPACLSLLPGEWKIPLEVIKQYYTDYYGHQLHSLYLRGSLARGTYVSGVSDVDVFGLIKKEELHWEKTPFNPALTSMLSEKMQQSLSLETMVSSFHQKLDEQYPQLAVILKTQSVCIWGTDIIPVIPDFYPDRSVLMHHRWLQQDLEDFFSKKKKTILDRKAIHKMLIRCGLELVVERSGRFTLDLYPAVQLFVQYYPDQKAIMEQTLYYYLNPKEQLFRQYSGIEKLGNWLLSEIKLNLVSALD